MILMAARLAKLFVILTVLLVSVFVFRGKLEKRSIVWLEILLLLFSVLANGIAGAMPPLTEEIRLTALGERREEAQKEEVYLAGYTIDGKTYSAGKDLEITDGKWYWSGETYAWRIETDPRQPEGVTRTIAIRIPVGWERTLDFKGDVWRGMVEVSAGEKTWTVDTYSENSRMISVMVGRSQTSKLIWNQIYRLAVYTIVLLGAAAAIVRLFHMNPKKAEVWLEREGGKAVYTVIAVVAFLFMVYYAGNISFWNDEVLQISFNMGSLKTAIQYCLVMGDCTPPLYTICAWAWYQIAPFGERWLLLVSILPVVATVYVMGLTGEKLNGKRCGMLAACMTAFSATVWGYAAFEFRGYAFMLLFSALSLYTHIQKNLNGEKRKWLILYSVSLLGLAMSHYFGMLACALFFLSDGILFLKKEISRRFILPYILPGSVSFLWLCAVYRVTLQHRTPESIVSWYPVPKLSHIGDLLRFLTGNLAFTFWLFVLAEVYVLVCAGSKKESWTDFYQRLSVGMLGITICLLWGYGNFINQRSTMWERRYFIFLLPMVILLTAQIYVKLSDVLFGENMIWKRVVSLFAGLILVGNCLTVTTWSYVGTQPFREAADWLYSQSNDIFDKRTVIVVTASTAAASAWQEYYVSRQGRRSPLNVIQQYAVTEETLSLYDRIYLQYSHIALNDWLKSKLEENYTLEADHSNVQVKVYVRKQGGEQNESEAYSNGE